ncbi:radical SAM protein [Chloroflexota bacterium]
MLPKTSVLYEPKGKAREYSSLAINLYRGCSHRCEYCYAPATLRISKQNFYKPAPRDSILSRIEKDAQKLSFSDDKSPVLLCFTCDPYQPIDDKYQLTRKAIQILHSYQLNVMLLTKGGHRAERDFDLLTPNDWFGVTLTNLDDYLSKQWEPGASSPQERIDSLYNAHDRGIRTWVSLEPVLYPDVALEIIKLTHRYIDRFKVGVLNYHTHAKNIDWHNFAFEVKKLLDDLNCDYYLKDDLLKWL